MIAVNFNLDFWREILIYMMSCFSFFQWEDTLKISILPPLNESEEQLQGWYFSRLKLKKPDRRLKLA